jgi:hypothetical protein
MRKKLPARHFAVTIDETPNASRRGGRAMIRNPGFKQSWLCAFGFIVLLIGITACTHTVEQGKAFSDVGIQYADAVVELLDVTTDTVIEDDSNTLLYLQELTKLEDKKQEREKLEEFLKGHDDELSALVTTLEGFRIYARTLKGYFVNLQALATTDAPQSTAKAVAGLSDSINVASKYLLKSQGLTISESEKKVLASLGRLASKGFHSAMLREALKRDARIIGEQLLLHEKLLAKLSEILEHSIKKRYETEKKERVAKPYKNKEITDRGKWKKDRARLLRTAFFVESLETAAKAAREMRQAWEGMLEGKTDLGASRLLLEDINEITAVAHQLKEALK